MGSKAYLVLENGATFEGEYFGAEKDVVADVVFFDQYDRLSRNFDR